ncbi:hypothetical protein PoB_000298000 [Plakobranchus ocellatus]|uniref:Uncharacterized protein n=1 Tax=Plakobranchus ocellatus TaxID=259542 RepID=A0AAV3Y069_9GAST|nr:hypothetical protein PoB_000298000 [Plakobranchus ocellatus]
MSLVQSTVQSLRLVSSCVSSPVPDSLSSLKSPVQSMRLCTCHCVSNPASLSLVSPDLSLQHNPCVSVPATVSLVQPLCLKPARMSLVQRLWLYSSPCASSPAPVS